MGETPEVADPVQGRQHAHTKGHRGEFWARMYLRLKGYGILYKRYKTAVGEIDLVVKRGRQLIFVEVKSHASEEASLDHVTPSQKKRIVKAARWFISANPPLKDHQQRFDVITVDFSGKLWPKISHIKNAFQEE